VNPKVTSTHDTNNVSSGRKRGRKKKTEFQPPLLNKKNCIPWRDITVIRPPPPPKKIKRKKLKKYKKKKSDLDGGGG